MYVHSLYIIILYTIELAPAEETYAEALVVDDDGSFSNGSCVVTDLPQIEDATAVRTGDDEYTYTCLGGFEFLVTSSEKIVISCDSGSIWSQIADSCLPGEYYTLKMYILP